MDTLGYRFRSEALLSLALRHPSLGADNNQRLEFLGDAVLELCVSGELYQKHPEMPEGVMTRLRQQSVCEQALAAVARKLKLGDYLCMDHGSDVQGVRRQSGALSDAMEAVLAAVYLDGGFECACQVIRRIGILDFPQADEDAKSRLQELLQAKGQEAPRYQLILEEGPDHARRFTVSVSLQDGRCARGEGSSKKQAEQAAAAAMLSELKELSDA